MLYQLSYAGVDSVDGGCCHDFLRVSLYPPVAGSDKLNESYLSNRLEQGVEVDRFDQALSYTKSR